MTCFLYGHLSLVDKSAKNNLSYEMGYTPKEFKKTLRGLFISQTPYSCKELSILHWEITVEDQTTRVNIRIKKSPPRILALLTLPVLQVIFTFDKTTGDQQDDFMKTFFRYFHKGGG